MYHKWYMCQHKRWLCRQPLLERRTSGPKRRMTRRSKSLAYKSASGRCFSNNMQIGLDTFPLAIQATKPLSLIILKSGQGRLPNIATKLDMRLAHVVIERAGRQSVVDRELVDRVQHRIHLERNVDSAGRIVRDSSRQRVGSGQGNPSAVQLGRSLFDLPRSAPAGPRAHDG